jgi:protein-L-isoaspartate(D-aspartate) O-methyltransferase
VREALLFRAARRCALVVVVAATACGERAAGKAAAPLAESRGTAGAAEREAMVREIEVGGIRDPRVLAAMRAVPRHRFVPEDLRPLAYDDTPLPIGGGQTISQPYVVARMVEALRLRGDERVLEVGSGSGYAAAVLSQVAAEVRGIELERELWERSVAVTRELGYRNVHLRHGDGFAGWAEAAPFQAILLSCAAEAIPAPLWQQLAVGGRLLFPRGRAEDLQQLVLVTKTPEGPREEVLDLVRFVPMRRGP